MYQYFDVNEVADVPPNYPLVRLQQTQTVRYDCSQCDSLFTSRKYLHEHEASAHNRLFHCPFCPCLFSNKTDFRTHINAHSERRLPCSFCKQVFHQHDEYSAHLKKHIEPSVFRCEKCPAYFHQLSMLRTHLSTHVQKKFVHNIPETLESCSSKKLLKKVLKELRLVSKITQANEPRRADSQTTDLSVPNGSAQLNSVPIAPAPSVNADILSDDDFQVIEPNPQNVPCTNEKENIRQNSYSLRKKRNLTSDAPTSSNCVSAPDPVASTSAKQIEASQSKKKPILKKKKVSKPKPTPTENVDPENILAPSTSCELNGEESAVRLRRKCRIISTSQNNELSDSDDDDVAPPRNNKSNGKNSSSEIDLGRNLRSRTIAKNLNHELSAVEPKANYNLRPGTKRKSAVCAETSKSPDNNTETVNPTSSRSNIPTGFFMCLSCKRVFKTFCLLNQHKELHILNKGLRCDECGGLFGGAANLASHKKSLQCCTT